jgi:hypothetical protein
MFPSESIVTGRFVISEPHEEIGIFGNSFGLITQKGRQTFGS